MPDLVTSRQLDQIAHERLLWRFGLSIAGIEVTQATQYYQSDEHLTDSADRGADNGIRLVAGKPAWVRVYLWSLFGAAGLTGTLEVRTTLGRLPVVPRHDSEP